MGVGWVVVDVEPSLLGPYMIDAYKEKRYYKRTGESVHPMSEQEVRDAYAIALRVTERRTEVWKKHALPIALTPTEPWLVLSALPLEPLRDIFDARQIDLAKLRGSCSADELHKPHRSDLANHGMRHWRDGLAAHDGADGADPESIVRLHRDGAAGIAARWRTQLRVDWVARVANALVLYMAWFWKEFSLTRPVELELSLVGIMHTQTRTNTLVPQPSTVVQPAGVQVDNVAVVEEFLPWELLRASVRHRLLQRLCDRLEQAFRTA